MRLFIAVFIFFFGMTIMLPQGVTAQKELLELANENNALVKKYPKEAFQEAKRIVVEAKETGAKEAELVALMTFCDYYRSVNDFDKLLKTSTLLFQTAKSYKYPVYQAVAKYDLFEAYFFTDLLDEAFTQIKEGVKIVENIDENDAFTIKTKTNLYFAYVNYFSLNKDFKNQYKYMKLAEAEFEKMQDKELKQKYLNTYQSNLASYYMDLGQLDSAQYYAELSILNEKKFNRSFVLFFNYLMLGEIGMKRGGYREALNYLQEAEKLDGYKNHINVEELYNNIIESYYKLNELEMAKSYEAKRDSLKLNIAESRNKSLYSLLIKKESKIPNKILIYISAFVFLIMTGIIFRMMKRNRTLANQEKISQLYLEEASQSSAIEDYSILMNALAENDPTFMLYFNDVFPNFSQKLLRINPKLSESELEFCAMLKLKIPTKEIGKYKFIATKTVLNKKYLIRKKFNIPKDMDIYRWIDEV